MKEKNIKVLNYVISICFFIGTILCVIFDFKKTHIATYLFSVVIILSPYFLKKFLLKLSEFEAFIYNAFIFFAYFLGSVVNLYNTTNWYDVLMHFISGFVVVYFGLIILKKLNIYSKKNRLFNFIFFVALAGYVAGMWEIVEFSFDKLFGMNLQHTIESGIFDTMEDIICANIGALIYSIYLVRKND